MIDKHESIFKGAKQVIIAKNTLNVIGTLLIIVGICYLLDYSFWHSGVGKWLVSTGLLLYQFRFTVSTPPSSDVEIVSHGS